MKSRIFALLVIGATAIGMAGWVGCSSESEATDCRGEVVNDAVRHCVRILWRKH